MPIWDRLFRRRIAAPPAGPALRSLFHLTRRRLHNSFARGEKRKFLLLAALGVFFWLVTGYFAWRVFGYLAHLPEVPLLFQLYLAEKLLSMVFLTVFSMLLISALVASLHIFFLSGDTAFLLTTPLSVRAIFAWKTLQTIVNSAALAVFFSLPLLLAFQYYFARGLTAWLAISTAYALFVLGGALLGILIGTTAPLFFSVRRLQPVLSVAAVVVISLMVVLLRLLRPERFLAPGEIADIFAYMRSMRLEPFSWLPFTWLARTMGAVARGEYSAYWAWSGLLAALALALTALLDRVAARLYLPMLDKLHKGGRSTYRSRWRPSPASYQRILGRKEWKTFWRTPAQWSQLLVIAALVAVFVLNIRSMPVSHPSVRQFIAYLNFGVVLFIVAGLHSRFTFPAVGGEGGGMVHLAASPLPRRRFIRFKFLYYLLPHLVAGFTLFAVGLAALGVDRFSTLAGTLFLLPAMVFLTVLALHFGAMVPERAAVSPQHALLSRAGVAYMLISLGFVVLCLVYQVRPYFLYYYSRFIHETPPWTEIAIWFTAFPLLLSLAAAWLYRRTVHRWEQRDF